MAPGQKGQEQKIVLELGDLLNRIPAHLLKPGAHDAAQRIFFKMSDLSSNLAEGKATIPLSSIASRCPEIFRKEIGPEDDVEIFFPWSKLLERVRNYKAMMDQPQGGEKNPAMHYKGQGAPTPAIRFRQNVATPAAPARPAEPAASSPAPASAAPPSPEKEKAEPPATPSEAPLTSTTPMSPLASRRLKQNWFNAAPALTQMPATEPAASAPAPASSTPSTIPGPTIPGPQVSAKQTVLGTLPPPTEPAPASAPAAKTLSLATEPSSPVPGLSLEKPAATSAKSGERSAEALAKECATLFEEKAKLAAEFTRAKEIHQNLLEKLTIDREAAIDENNKTLLQLAELRTDYEKKLQTLRDDHHKQIAALKGEGASAQQQAGAEVANIVKQKDEALSKATAEIEARNKQLEAAGKQLEAVGQERDTIHGHKVKLEQELAAAKDQYRKEIEAALEARDTIWVEKDEIAGKLHKAAKEHAEKAAQAKAEHEKSLQSAQENFDKQIAALKEQHEKSLAEKESLLSKHGEAAERERDAQIKQKDEALAKLGAEIEGYKKQIEALGKEKADALQSAAEKHAAEVKAAESLHQEAGANFEKQIAALKADHERKLAEKESLLSKHGEAADQQRNALLKEKDAALAKANADLEAHKKQIASLKEEHERKLAEKESLLSKHGEAGQQLNALIKERDEALTGLAVEIDSHKKQIEALGKEKADTAAKHAQDLKAADALHHEAMQSACADFEKQIAALKEEHHLHIAERDSLLSKHGEAAEQQRNALIKQM
ncbi:MAG TPA: hypothetical protein VG733_15945, partial [Chthoniobacteraceae bacterium]|nr:hypothetical protein [Chthoniobacteraceae bacterium]